MRILKLLGAGIGILIVLAAVVLVVGIPGGWLTEVIQNRFERQTGYRLEIESTKIALRPQLTLALGGVSLFGPQDRDASAELAVSNIKVKISLASLLRGSPHIDDVILSDPVLLAPLHRERTRRSDGAGSATAAGSGNGATTNALLGVSHVEVDNGAVILADKRRGVEHRFDNVALDATIGDDRSVRLTINAQTRGQPIGLEANALVPDGPVSGSSIPVDFKLKAPSVLTQQLAATATVKLDGKTVMIDAVKGDLDGALFGGNAAIDFDGKPLVKLNLNLTKIGLVAPWETSSASEGPSAQSDAPRPWSDRPFDLRGLNYVDGEAHLSIGELDIGTLNIAPLEIDGNLTDGVVRGTASKIGVYEGQAAAGLAMDVSNTPSFALRTELRQVHALPLLSSAADFTSLDGKLDATINVQAVGSSQRELIGSLAGITAVKFQDGEIKGVNVAKMIRALTAGTLSGWQNGPSEATDLTELGMSFQIDHGQAQTQDLQLAGPLVRVSGIGTVDLNTKAMNFRVEPKLVMSIQGQGSSTDPVGLGIPVMIQGPWNHPRIFPDMAGILDNPDAAYAQLRQLGQGLFGPNFLQPNASTGNNASGGNGNNVMGNIGSLIQGLTGSKGNQGQGQDNPQSPSGAAPNQAQGTDGQGQANAGQNQGPGQQSGTPQAGQPATGGGLGQILGPQQQNQLDQIMHNLFGQNPSK
jgi:AsmA protein